MSKAYENLLKAVAEMERERVKERIEENMNKRKVVPYIRVGNEEQLDQLDSLFAKGVIDTEEYITIRRRLSGDRNA